MPLRTDANAVSTAVAALVRSGTPFVDLTESNPTRAEIPYPPEIPAALADPRVCRYEPHPLGLPEAREAVAEDCRRRGAAFGPGQIVLSASTSEAYSWLFKLLCAPGDAVLVPQPSYPLFEHLTRLEGVRAIAYRLEYHGRWEVDLEAIAAGPADVRAVLTVSPNNPTGSYLDRREIERLAEICAARGWALVVDEVFADYALDEAAPATDLAQRGDALVFTLGGASKTLGLPQVKLAWTIVGGPRAAREDALGALEIIADTYLSVGAPVQVAAPRLFRLGAAVRAAIHARVRNNLALARTLADARAASDVLRVEGGWSAVVRVPATSGEEDLVLRLLDRERILVHPGYFFDFRHEAFLVVSLLPPEPVFADAFARLLDAVGS